MTACLCPQCSSTPAPTYSPEFRHACEVRHVANLPSKDARKLYLIAVGEQRGKAAVDRLLEGLRGDVEAGGVMTAQKLPDPLPRGKRPPPPPTPPAKKT